jgi:DNA-binding beta-propeller fold protein YncE
MPREVYLGDIICAKNTSICEFWCATPEPSNTELMEKNDAIKSLKMRLAAAWAITLCAAIGTLAQSPPTRSLLALSKRNHRLAIVDPNTLRVIARTPVGPDPHEVIASSDGKTAYVSIYGGGRYHALSVIDLVGQKALPDIDTGALNGPHGLAFVGGKLWFTAEGAKAIAT